MEASGSIHLRFVRLLYGVNAALFVEGLLGERHGLDEHLSPKAVPACRKWQAGKVGVEGTGVPVKRSLMKLGRRYGSPWSEGMARQLPSSPRPCSRARQVSRHHRRPSVPALVDGTRKLPVEADLRKSIGRQAADTVTVHLQERTPG
jgi:hypothetical protein